MSTASSVSFGTWFMTVSPAWRPGRRSGSPPSWTRLRADSQRAFACRRRGYLRAGRAHPATSTAGPVARRRIVIRSHWSVYCRVQYCD
jgi:hypothetical protein